MRTIYLLLALFLLALPLSAVTLPDGTVATVTVNCLNLDFKD